MTTKDNCCGVFPNPPTAIAYLSSLSNYPEKKKYCSKNKAKIKLSRADKDKPYLALPGISCTFQGIKAQYWPALTKKQTSKSTEGWGLTQCMEIAEKESNYIFIRTLL